jgi:hypothetical protein
MFEGDRSLTAFALYRGRCAQAPRIVQESQLAPLANKRNKRRV